MTTPAAGARSQVERIYSLTPLQEGMVFHATLAPDSNSYVEQVSCRLRGRLDVRAFERAWTWVVGRHQALRTSLHRTDRAQSRQIVHRQVRLPWTVLDWRALDGTDRAARLDELGRQDWRRGFDLTRAPLFRLTVVLLDDDAYELVWTNHHALLDGWSRTLILREVMDAYTAYAAGGTPSAGRAGQFGEYVAWLGARPPEPARRFWRSRLEGFTTPTPLPESPARRPDAAADGRTSASATVSAARTAALTELCRRHGLTMATVVSGAWALLLSRYGGGDDVVFGTTVAGRPAELPDADTTVGLFINTVPVRVRTDTDEPTAGWLRRLQYDGAAAREFDHAPLADIQVCSDVPAGQQLFDSIVVVENYPVRAPGDTTGPAVEQVRPREQTHYPLVLVAAHAGVLGLRLNYDPGRFDPRTVGAMLTHLERILDLLAADAGTVAALDGLPGDERRLVQPDPLLADDLPDGPPVPWQVLARAAAAPDAVAVLDGANHVTYSALVRRATALALVLRRRGAGPEVIVAVCLPRSAALVETLLAVHLAGAAYLPLDAAHPAERLSFMLRDSGARLVVTASGVLPPDTTGAALVRLDDDAIRREMRTGAPAHGEAAVGDGNLAYVIYTSGSTGTPKATEIGHRGLRHLVRWHLDAFGLDPRDRATQVASPAFDACGWEIWPALAAGVSLSIITDDTRTDLRRLTGVLDEHGCTVSFLPTPLAEHLFDAERPPAAPFRLLLTGGDRLTRRPPPTHRYRLVNNYGPTETSVVATSGAVPAGTATPSIGRPIRGIRCYVLDRRLRPVPVGVAGDLYIAGDGVGRGYRGRPALTGETFLPDPFSPRPGARMYRTGDLVRWRHDGELDFIGRSDRQIKVRGHRIEPGEIESLLGTHPGVTAAVISPDGHGGLIAHVAADAGTPVADLRSLCASALPDYMRPATFVILDSLPQTSNGKIDVARLPQPGDTATGGLLTGDAEPLSPTGQIIAGLWGDVLGVDDVTAHDDFFRLGGHSLTLAQVHTRLRAVFEVDLPLRDLFTNPTVASLAAVVDTARRGGTVPADPRLTAGSRPMRIPLSFAQQRMWFFDQWEPGSPLYNITGGLRLRGALDRPALQRSLDGLVARHESLRTTFTADAGRPYQVIVPAAPAALPRIDLSGLAPSRRETELAVLHATGARRPFDLAAGPLLRTHLVVQEPGEHVLLLCVHHIVADGWSVSILLRELATGYGGPPPATPSVQYADFTLWQRARVHGERLDRQIVFWREQIAGAPPLLALPTDFPRPAVLGFAGQQVGFTLSPAVRLAVHRFARQVGATPFMVLLSAYQVMLARLSGQTDILVATPVANRPTAETETMIGLFANTVVLRSQITDEVTFERLVRTLRDTCLRVFDHQDVPFEQVVDELCPERQLSHAPLAQVAFGYQQIAGATDAWPGLSVETVAAAGSRTAKFDLTVALTDVGTTLSGIVEYNRDLFTDASAQALRDQFVATLEALLAGPRAPVATASSLSAAGRDRMLKDWSGAGRPVTTGRPLHLLVADRAGERPDAAAVVAGDRHVSYGYLDRAAGRLAAHLRTLGVGGEKRVGVCLPRGEVDMIVAALGIWKAGGTYVPLDPAYPSARLTHMLSDSGIALVIVAASTAAAVAHGAVTPVYLEGVRTHGPAVDLPEVRADQLAYIIYTSGSTGRPKGVMLSHHGLQAMVDAQRDAFATGPGSRVVQFASPSFDASVFEIAMALAAGGTLVLGSRESLMPGPDLLDVLDRQSATIVTLPPSALLVTPPTDLPALRTIAVAGEACPAEVVRQWAPGRAFFNLYGPTEDTVWTTARRCDPDEPVTIGRPIAGSIAYVLDAHLQPVAPGVPGELFVGGAGLARGYIGMPALTALHFIPNPHSNQPGSRLYRTGDHTRWHPHHTLEFLGRHDTQLKIRGYRIETTEIEAIIRTHPTITDTTVQPHPHQHTTRLTAYITTNPTDTTPLPDLINSLRHHTAQHLPDYMIPTTWTHLPHLPLTPNGKLDTNALPTPNPQRPTHTTYTPPTTPTETTLTTIWSDILGITPISRHDNFFTLGGDSILTIQIVARANQHHIPITPKHLFQHPTIAELATTADHLTTTNTPTNHTPQHPTTGPQPPTPIQTWFINQQQPHPHHYNQAILLQPHQPLHHHHLNTALHHLLTHHDALRTQLHHHPDNTTTLTTAPPPPPHTTHLTTIDLTHLPPHHHTPTLNHLTTTNHTTINLTQGRLLNTTHITLTPTNHRLHLVAHHLTIDTVSWHILLNDLTTLYHQTSHHQQPTLPPKTTPYQHWAHHLHQHTNHPTTLNDLPHWTNTPHTPIPTDHPHHPHTNTQHTTHTITTTLNPTTTNHLLRPTNHTTTQELLLTALTHTLTTWTHHTTHTIDTENHGRNTTNPTINLTRTIGWFTTIHPLTLTTTPNHTTTLHHTKNTLRNTPHHGTTYTLLHHLTQHPTITTQPPRQIRFNYLGQINAGRAVGDLFTAAPESSGPSQHPETRRPYLIDINAVASAEQLQVSWTYSTAVHEHATIDALAQAYLADLRAVAAIAADESPAPLRADDFPLAQLDDEQLAAIAAMLGRKPE